MLDIVEDADAVLDWFGCWPTFHDAEVSSVALQSDLPSTIEIVTSYGRTAPAVVTFTFRRVVDVHLEDFSVQNVIARLTITRVDGAVRMELRPCFGIGGYIEARA